MLLRLLSLNLQLKSLQLTTSRFFGTTAMSFSPSSNSKRDSKATSAPVFERLNQTLYIHKPDPSVKTKSPSNEGLSAIVPPRTVILFGFMDGPLKIMSKYGSKYAEKWPHATVIIKLSRGDHYLQGKSQKLKAVEELVGLLEAEG